MGRCGYRSTDVWSAHKLKGSFGVERTGEKKRIGIGRQDTVWRMENRWYSVFVTDAYIKCWARSGKKGGRERRPCELHLVSR